MTKIVPSHCYRQVLRWQTCVILVNADITNKTRRKKIFVFTSLTCLWYVLSDLHLQEVGIHQVGPWCFRKNASRWQASKRWWQCQVLAWARTLVLLVQGPGRTPKKPIKWFIWSGQENKKQRSIIHKIIYFSHSLDVKSSRYRVSLVLQTFGQLA